MFTDITFEYIYFSRMLPLPSLLSRHQRHQPQTLIKNYAKNL